MDKNISAVFVPGQRDKEDFSNIERTFEEWYVTEQKFSHTLVWHVMGATLSPLYSQFLCISHTITDYIFLKTVVIWKLQNYHHMNSAEDKFRKLKEFYNLEDSFSYLTVLFICWFLASTVKYVLMTFSKVMWLDMKVFGQSFKVNLPRSFPYSVPLKSHLESSKLKKARFL